MELFTSMAVACNDTEKPTNVNICSLAVLPPVGGETIVQVCDLMLVSGAMEHYEKICAAV
jgi:hypothetical protein